MPSASLLALSLALGVAVLSVLPPNALAARVHTGVFRKNGHVDDDDDDDDGDVDDDDDTVSASTINKKVEAAVAAAIAAPNKTLAPKSAPSSLLKIGKMNSSMTTTDDDSDDDSDGEDDAGDESNDDPEVQRLKTQEKLERSALENVTEELDVTAMKETQAKARLADLEDPAADKASDQEIRLAVQAIANETQSETLATTLGKMWSEMRMYAGPFYQEHITKEIKQLGEHEQTLDEQKAQIQAKLAKTRNNLEKALGEKPDEKVVDSVVKTADDQTGDDHTDDHTANKEKEVSGGEDKPARDRATTRLYLGVWCGVMVALVLVVYVVARRQL